MTAIMRSVGEGLRTIVSDITQGFFEVTHNGFALVGLTVMFAGIALTAQPELRQVSEIKLIDWLQDRQLALTGIGIERDAVERATAVNPKELPKQQAHLANWLSKKYRIAPEPLSALVAEAYQIGSRTQIEPTLILAIMAIESGFNPFAQSAVGAQGLMQVMTRVHSDKYDNFGGKFAAFDPISNLRVGVKVLQECIARAGSIEGGLRAYVGATNLDDDGGYVDKVLQEQDRLNLVAQGQAVPTSAAQLLPTATPSRQVKRSGPLDS